METIRLPDCIIDPHCHGRDMHQRHKTTLSQTLWESRLKLISLSAFMPNTDPPLVDYFALETYLGLLNSASSRLGLPDQYVWFGATDENFGQCQKVIKHPQVIGIKVYPQHPDGKKVTTGPIGVAKDETIRGLMSLSASTGKPIAFHCDDPFFIAREGHTIRAEAAYVERVLALARMFPQVKIVICHVSSIQSAKLVLGAQERKMNVMLEIAPHYLWFDSSDINRKPGLNPIFYRCFNRLRPPENRKYLTELIKIPNPLVMIGSDNAPHTVPEKLTLKLGGLPSNQEMVAVICTLAKEHGILDEQVACLLSRNAAQFFGIQASPQLKKYRLVRRTDDLQYNDGVVANPWNGSELLFPEPIGKEEDDSLE